MPQERHTQLGPGMDRIVGLLRVWR
jgi:hypothetical protein